MRKNERGFTVGVMLFMIIVWLGLGAFSLWVGGSLITSGVKAVTEDCGKTYGIEKFVSGDWFCPEDE